MWLCDRNTKYQQSQRYDAILNITNENILRFSEWALILTLRQDARTINPMWYYYNCCGNLEALRCKNVPDFNQTFYLNKLILSCDSSSQV